MSLPKYRVLSLSEPRGGSISATEFEVRLNELADLGYRALPITVPNRIVLELDENLAAGKKRAAEQHVESAPEPS